MGIDWMIFFIVLIFVGMFYFFGFSISALKWVFIFSLLIGAYFAYSTFLDNSSLKEDEKISDKFFLYLSWLGGVLPDLWNIGKDTVRLVGNAIRIEGEEFNKTAES